MLSFQPYRCDHKSRRDFFKACHPHALLNMNPFQWEKVWISQNQFVVNISKMLGASFEIKEMLYKLLWLSFFFLWERQGNCYSQSIPFFPPLLENICHVDAFLSHCQWRKMFASLSPHTVGGERFQIELRTHQWAPNKWFSLKAEVLPFILQSIIDTKYVYSNS